ncbi:MAG: flagellar type III secretion system pore protein FliP [Candidatus Krumholzibacteria bacterium]|nr:flagellar type III secretion system pore protein FliP [Candidatus Krumholzibacteria bacterium]
MLQNPLTTTKAAGRWVAVLVLMFVTAASNMTYAQTGGQEPSAIEAIDLSPPAAAPITLTLEGASGPEGMDSALKILVLMTVLSLAPAFLILLTSFTRIVIVLGFLRQAIGANQAPSNQIIIGLALFLTLVVMSPVFSEMNTTAIEPFMNEEMSQEEAFAKIQIPLKDFMLSQVREKDIALFLDLTDTDAPDEPTALPMLVVVPAFVLSELKTAFQMGFILFIPFLIIDMVVASVLMSMGMMMLPPVLISLPFKILLFVLVDGWFLVVKSLVQAFQ